MSIAPAGSRLKNGGRLILLCVLALVLLFGALIWRVAAVNSNAQGLHEQSELICTNQLYIQTKLARLVELAAPAQLAAGRAAVYAEFLRTAKELRARHC